MENYFVWNESRTAAAQAMLGVIKVGKRCWTGESLFNIHIDCNMRPRCMKIVCNCFHVMRLLLLENVAPKFN